MGSFAYFASLACGAFAGFFWGPLLMDLYRRYKRRNQLRLNARQGVQADSPGLLGAWKQKRKEQRRKESYDKDLPAMLDVVSLGMKTGLSFDGALEVYVQRFDLPLAQECEQMLTHWRSGLITREEGMKELAERIDSAAFSRFVSLILRSIRFGVPATETLAELAKETRKQNRTEWEKKVAKAPVKMLIPTAVCILPAMLVLIIGPILLQLVGEMG